MNVHDVRQVIADAHRREWAFVLAATARVARDIDLAEECVQDAYVAALDAWSRNGVPRSPGAWLVLALMGTAACQEDVAHDAYQRAEALDAAVNPFGGRLQAARANPIWPPCRA